LEKEFRRRDSLPFWGEGDIVSAGELIVEIMRPNVNQPLDQIGQFNGPGGYLDKSAAKEVELIAAHLPN